MRTVEFTAPIFGGQSIEVLGHPTATPGLVVQLGYQPCNGECWQVTYVRSGLTFPFCWPSPEPAGEYATRVAAVGDWTHSQPTVLRMCKNNRRRLVKIAEGLGARRHKNIGPVPNKNTRPVDNSGASGDQ